MKTFILILGGLVACAAGETSQATEPFQASEKAAPLTVGAVLLLENDHVLDGEIERIGDQYRVKRSTGETWVAGSRVLTLCATYEDAYLFLRSRANLTDADERLRLAQWCRQFGLRARALEEVKAAVELRPEHAMTRRLLNGLLQADDSIVAQRPAKPQPEIVPLPPQDVGSDSVNQFITKVQPILMNTCLSCHGTGQGGNFRIQRCFQVGSVNRKTMQQNLAAVIAEIDLAQPGMSPLLIKAVSTHCEGMSKAPIKDRQAGAYKILLEWVEMTVKTNPHLLPQRTAEVTTSTAFGSAGSPSGMKETKALNEKPSVFGSDSAPKVAVTVASTPAPLPAAPVPTGPMTDEKVPVQKGDDVVDPGPFNQQNHPAVPPRKP